MGFFEKGRSAAMLNRNCEQLSVFAPEVRSSVMERLAAIGIDSGVFSSKYAVFPGFCDAQHLQKLTGGDVGCGDGAVIRKRGLIGKKGHDDTSCM